MEATTQYFGKRFFINRSLNFIALQNFYARHLGVKITGPYGISIRVQHYFYYDVPLMYSTQECSLAYR
jgi:hypothetical protein